MAADTIAEQQNGNGTPPEAAAEKTRQDMFRYASLVHVGEGAEECEHAEDGACQDDTHFHAWVRLPNPFQVRDIAEKAKAARARKVRMMKDTESDAYVVLESELDGIKSEESRPLLVSEILDGDFVQDYDAAMKAVLDMDDPDYVPKDDDDEIPKLYANIRQDQEEYERQSLLPEDQREEDYEELQKTMARFGDHLQEELEKIKEPRTKQLNERPIEELVDIIRQERIKSDGDEAYLHTYNSWMWFVCTFKPKKTGTPNERVFKDFTQFKYETPSEVIAVLQQTFTRLEGSLAGERAKNS